MEHDALSLWMFLTGALMAFAPLVVAGVVVLVIRHQRRKEAARKKNGEW